MAEPIFPASRLKVERAHGFIAELQRLVKSHVDQNPPLITPIDTSDGKHTFDIEWANLGLLPGVIVGDVVHNLRTALDLMASDLAARNGRSNKDVYFPVADSEEALEGRISGQKFSKAGDDAVELLRSFRPYRGGGNLLRDLHDLNNADKHTALIAVHSDTGMYVDFRRDPQDANKLIIKPVIERVEIYFPDEGPLAGEPIIEMLKQMAELVESILEAFSALVKSRD